MATSTDRRAPGVSRVPFDAMVEVGGALGPAFEAQAVNVSQEGMSLRTAYLPEIGQPITCRFDAGHGVVVATGEVLWREDLGDGGEFGIRFTDLDGQSATALRQILGPSTSEGEATSPDGRKIRLHIDGLASPMRARVKRESGPSVTAYSELGFLQLGRPLELEDAASSMKRPALIDRVEVEVEPASHVPQLIVTLRYDDEEARAAAPSIGAVSIDEPAEGEAQEAQESAEAEDVQPPPQTRGVPLSAAEASFAADGDADEAKLKSTFARGAEKARVEATAAFEKMTKRAKTAVAMIAARMKKGDDGEVPVRRTTAPPPDGALHASGRRVVRSSVPDDEVKEPAPKPGFALSKKKKLALGGAVGAAALLAIFAMRKSPAPPPTAAASAADSAPAVALHATATPPGSPGMPGALGAQGATPNDPLAAAAAGAGMSTGDFGDPSGAGKKGKPVPFANGTVAHGNVLKLKMDGPIGNIQGAASPTGFTVTLPGRKSLDSAAPLAAKDPRIAAIKVENETGGAALTVTFKDGVPNYVVKAHGDTLEMHLAKPSHAGEAHASKKKKHH